MEPIATVKLVLSYPKKPSPTGQEAVRHARQCDEGVCVPSTSLGTSTPPQCEFDTYPCISPVSAGQPVSPPQFLTDIEIIDRIRTLTLEDPDLLEIIKAIDSPTLRHGKRGTPEFSTSEGLVYRNNLILVPNDNHLKTEILRSRHDTKLAGHPGRSKTLSLVRRSFTWPSMKRFVNRYVDGCDSCQRVKASTQ